MAYIGAEPIVSATRTITEVTATAGQTVFVANGGYTVGYIDVFLNGAQLQTSDFTATNGSSITLTEAAQAGDVIRLVAWGTFSTSTSVAKAGDTMTGDLTLNNGSADGAQLVLASSGYDNWNLDNYNGRFRAYNGSTERMTIDSSGNVGIGTSNTNGYKVAFKAGAKSQFFTTDSSSSYYYTDGNYYFGAIGADNVVAITSNVERMRIDSSGNLLFNSGYGSVAKAYGCRAWVNFNGTGTVAINASGNVSSITDYGVGDYGVNFTTAMPDAVYAAVPVSGDNSTSYYAQLSTNTTYATTYFRFRTGNSSAYVDMSRNNVAVFR